MSGLDWLAGVVFGWVLGTFTLLLIQQRREDRRQRLQSEREHRDWLRKMHEDSVSHIKSTRERIERGARSTDPRFEP